MNLGMSNLLQALLDVLLSLHDARLDPVHLRVLLCDEFRHLLEQRCQFDERCFNLGQVRAARLSFRKRPTSVCRTRACNLYESKVHAASQQCLVVMTGFFFLLTAMANTCCPCLPPSSTDLTSSSSASGRTIRYCLLTLSLTRSLYAFSTAWYLSTALDKPCARASKCARRGGDRAAGPDDNSCNRVLRFLAATVRDKVVRSIALDVEVVGPDVWSLTPLGSALNACS